MSRIVRLYPGSDTNLFTVQPWVDIVPEDPDKKNATELWIDSNYTFNNDYRDFLEQQDLFNGIERVCFFDFFHAYSVGSQIPFKRIEQVASKYPTMWYTCNANPIKYNIPTQRVDYVWNRAKRAYLDHAPGWKMSSNPRAYQQHPLNFDRREQKFMSLNRAVNAYRVLLLQLLKPYEDQGFLSHVNSSKILSNQYVDTQLIQQGINIPPDREYFDKSYMSFQVESQYSGVESIIFTEKTYDHLIQGRLVLNFGPPGFYRALEKDGWRLPVNIDLTFDSIEHDHQRWLKYADSVESLVKLSLNDLHDLFLLNRDVIEHNYEMLRTKPYDYID